MNARAEVKGEVSEVEMKQPAVVAPPAVPAPVPAPRKKRRFGRYLVMLALPLALIGGGSYVWATGGRFQETENANLRQAKVSIASDTAGRIVTVNVTDNQAVKEGDVLFEVDAQPYRIALSEADAALAGARLKIEQLRAAYSQAVAQEAIAKGELDYAKTQFDRQTELAGKGIAAKSALDEARRDLDKAQEELSGAEQGIIAARAALGGNADIVTDSHPTVLSALAARDKAAWDLARTTVRAPADGIVSQASSFKAGQFVGAGTAVFSLVETGDAWVEANFKETQLTHMKLGQEAEIWLDTYPDHAFKAKVAAIGAGTGAEFSLLPAQNATGNWVKVTQRIPVRLQIEDPDAALTMRTGMSATVSVDTGVTRGFGSLLGNAFAGEK